MKLIRTIEVASPLDRVFAYLADFTTTNQWDPGTVSTTLIDGDGGVGTTYANVSTFLGQRSELTYTVIELQPQERLVLRGVGPTLVAIDTLTFASTATGGTRVTYDADFTFSGLGRFVVPLLAPAFKRFGDRAAEGLRSHISRL
jgi:uncharacterized protein YndB with AHSA1/START domain